jgi:hypothetical protein
LQARPRLLGHDLDGQAGAAVVGGPAALLQPADHHHADAPAQRLGGVLGLVAPDHHGEEARLAVAVAARDRDPERGSGDAAVGGVDLGVVGEVAAKLTLASVMVHPS